MALRWTLRLNGEEKLVNLSKRFSLTASKYNFQSLPQNITPCGFQEQNAYNMVDNKRGAPLSNLPSSTKANLKLTV